MKQTNFAKSVFLLLSFICFIVLCFVLKVTQSFIIPIVVSVLLACVFFPLVKKLKKFHIPQLLSIILITVLILVFIFFIGTLLVSAVKTLISAYPRYEERFTSIYSIFCKTFHIKFDEDLSLINNIVNTLDIPSLLQKYLLTTGSTLLAFVKVVFVILLFMVFLLLEMTSMKNKIITAFSGTNGNKILLVVTKTMSEVTRYISIKTIISLLTGLIIFAVTSIFSMDFAIIWGFLAFILNFIPTFGSIISCASTILFAVLQFYPSWFPVIVISFVCIATDFILGNIVEPRWEGADLGLSPFIILVSLSLWGWMWGFAGMILSVPLMVCIKIICENFEMLEPFAIFLGNSRSAKKKYRMKREKLNKEDENKKIDSNEN